MTFTDDCLSVELRRKFKRLQQSNWHAFCGLICKFWQRRVLVQETNLQICTIYLTVDGSENSMRHTHLQLSPYRIHVMHRHTNFVHIQSHSASALDAIYVNETCFMLVWGFVWAVRCQQLIIEQSRWRRRCKIVITHFLQLPIHLCLYSGGGLCQINTQSKHRIFPNASPLSISTGPFNSGW